MVDIKLTVVRYPFGDWSYGGKVKDQVDVSDKTEVYTVNISSTSKISKDKAIKKASKFRTSNKGDKELMLNSNSKSVKYHGLSGEIN